MIFLIQLIYWLRPTIFFQLLVAVRREPLVDLGWEVWDAQEPLLPLKSEHGVVFHLEKAFKSAFLNLIFLG